MRRYLKIERCTMHHKDGVNCPYFLLNLVMEVRKSLWDRRLIRDSTNKEELIAYAVRVELSGEHGQVNGIEIVDE